MTPEDLELLDALGEYAYDPIGFVMWAFPWGEPGELAKETGPDEWQLWLLTQVRDRIISPEKAIQIAVTSGHGVGKSALVSWLTLWAFTTFPGTRGVITANTESQLKTKTWVEIAKWHRLFIGKHLFQCTATALFSTDPDMAREWRMDIIPWSENNPEAFAGLHNAGKRLLVIFDEASTIKDIIWETTEGALTDENTEIMWFCFGNPTKNQGRFRDCFPGGKFAHRWTTREVDGREVKRTNKQQIEEWIADRGLDSDFVRIRVLGRFPYNDENSFIPLELAREAAARPLVRASEDAVVLGVDVARFGTDLSVIYPRQGIDARSRPPLAFQGLNTIQLAQRVMEVLHRYEASQVFVDEGGVGGGVVDQLQRLGCPVIGVQFGARADQGNPEDPLVKYANKRAEMWGALRSWLRRGCIVTEVPGIDATLPDELSAPTYDYQLKTEAIVLEAKKEMVRRGVPSPNVADALALTFAYPTFGVPAGMVVPAETEYNPFASERLYA